MQFRKIDRSSASPVSLVREVLSRAELSFTKLSATGDLTALAGHDKAGRHCYRLLSGCSYFQAAANPEVRAVVLLCIVAVLHACRYTAVMTTGNSAIRGSVSGTAETVAAAPIIQGMHAFNLHQMRNFRQYSLKFYIHWGESS